MRRYQKAFITKGKAIRVILTIALVALIEFVVLLYVTDITLRGKSPREELARMIVIVLTSLVALVRLRETGGGGSRGLARHERDCRDTLKGAFCFCRNLAQKYGVSLKVTANASDGRESSALASRFAIGLPPTAPYDRICVRACVESL